MRLLICCLGLIVIGGFFFFKREVPAIESNSVAEVVAYLRSYEGCWLGEFTIHSTATGYSQTFSVEQRYWWADGELHGMSVTETDDGMQTAKSRTFIQDAQLQAEITRGEVVERYLGVLHEGGLLWISDNLGRATDYQMKEKLVVNAGERWLQTDGFDSYLYEEGVAHLVYKGRLKEVDEADVVKPSDGG